jgi:hypothetical protein
MKNEFYCALDLEDNVLRPTWFICSLEDAAADWRVADYEKEAAKEMKKGHTPSKVVKVLITQIQ